MLEFKEVTSSGVHDRKDFAKKFQVGNRVQSKSSFSEGNCCEILNEQKKFTSLSGENVVLFIPCKLNFLCSTLPACTGPGLFPGEPSNSSALTNLDQECKEPPVIELSILGYMQDPDIPQSDPVFLMVFSLSFCNSYQTSVPSNINLLCTQGFTYT